MRKVSCIIPAYNEAARIGSVLAVAATHPLIDEVIVVDDGSTDDTAKVVAPFENEKVHLIIQPHNRGKSAALHTGIEAAHGELLFFLDADLIGLTAKDITDLIVPVLDGTSDVSISLRGNTPWLWRAIGLDYISGERVLSKKLLDNREEIAALPSFGFEVFLNRIWIAKKCRIKVVRWDGVASPYKHAKHGAWKGMKADARMMRHILSVASPLELVGQILKMRAARVTTP